MIEQFRFVTIGEHSYRIGRLTPMAGSYILFQIMNANLKRMGEMVNRPTEEVMPTNPDNAEALVRAATMGAFLGGFDFETHTKIQQMCLSKVSLMTETNGQPPMPLPIGTADGTLLPQIGNDVMLVMHLVTEVLAFNLSDFFAHGGLNALATAATI